MKHFLLIILVFFLSNLIFAQNKYQPEWESLQKYTAPEWFRDAKLGFWPIWGIYSVPAFGSHHAAEWYGRWMYCKEGQERDFLHPELYFKHHKETYGNQSEFGYKDFIPMFTADNFNADNWAELCEQMGAKYFCTLGIFHDGFNMGQSKLTKWNAVEMGPKRDVVGELAKAVRKRGLKYGVSNHYAFNPLFYMFNHMNGYDGKESPDLYGSPIITEGADTVRYKKEYTREEWLPILGAMAKHSEEDLNRWLARTKEMAEIYKPDLYYFDWGMNGSHFESRRKEFASFYYNKAMEWGKGTFGNPGVVLNYKNIGTMAEGAAVRDYERGGAKKTELMVWQTDDSVYDGHNWGYVEGTPIKDVNKVIDQFVRIVSRNGNLMLAFAPKADGSFPEDQKEFIYKFGDWMKACGEAIYATRPWIADQENASISGSEKTVRIHYTRSKDENTVYATLLNWHDAEITLSTVTAPNLADKRIKKVSLIGCKGKIKWDLTKNGLKVNLEGISPKNDYAWPIRIELK